MIDIESMDEINEELDTIYTLSDLLERSDEVENKTVSFAGSMINRSVVNIKKILKKWG